MMLFFEHTVCVLLPEGLCTYCSLCLELPVPTHWHDLILYFVLVFTPMSPPQLSFLGYLVHHLSLPSTLLRHASSQPCPPPDMVRVYLLLVRSAQRAGSVPSARTGAAT